MQINFCLLRTVNCTVQPEIEIRFGREDRADHQHAQYAQIGGKVRFAAERCSSQALIEATNIHCLAGLIVNYIIHEVLCVSFIAFIAHPSL